MNKPKKSGIPWVFFAILLFLWGIYAYGIVSNYAYTHPVIVDTSALWVYTIPNLFVPLLILGVIALFCAKHKHIGMIVCSVLFLIILPLGFFRCAGEMLYAPSFCSYSDDTADFGEYDPEVEERLLLMGERFTELCPDADQVTRYSYFYQNASDEVLYIAVQIPCSDERVAQLRAYDGTGNAAVWVCDLTEKPSSEGTKPYLYVSALVDTKGDTITCVATTKENWQILGKDSILWKLDDMR